ncbi:antibiotic biosynthesis monooxygenase [Wenjunlia vitaminophila]|uniref:Monooxygenase n=1 Tax=Wenjunlia vitaminophila TaxID=76728 RepID=A3R4R2_WENVI|nr:antibiotic biosynthesis monooxygenase family protein [Wenjunlia vitaminophila]ABO15857.1 monooxygenase [Wenjunlia vitaminophila]KRV49606.1 antibiotic biosynthesis monooxygenase [Wenjunlia vitaminophila]
MTANPTDVITLVNVYSVEPERQDELVDLLYRTADELMRHQPGFITAHIYRSMDGTRVTNYAQWRSMADFQAVQQLPEAAKYVKASAELGASDPHVYTVASVHTA